MSTDFMENKVATGSYFVKPAAHLTYGLVTLSGYAPLTRPTQLNRPPLTLPSPAVGRGLYKAIFMPIAES